VYKPVENEDEYESPSELCITPIRRYADLSDEAFTADTRDTFWRAAKSDTPIRFTALPRPSLVGRLSAFPLR
jgi:hypothetical protein